MGRIQALRGDNLQEGPASPGIVRHMAFRGDDIVVLRSRADPGVSSGWHHHGEFHVYGYMVSGTIHFESGPGGKDVTSVGEGDYFHVPPQTIHRDVNPSETEGQEVILFLQGEGDMVVNVDGPDPLRG